MRVKKTVHFMASYTTFIYELSEILGQALSASDETQAHTLTLDGEELFLRYLPEEQLWVYFGFVTDFMVEATPQQLAKALELNSFGRGTADYYLGILGKAIILSGRLAMNDEATPEQLAQQLAQLAEQLTPMHQTLMATEEDAPFATESDAVPYKIPLRWDEAFIQV